MKQSIHELLPEMAWQAGVLYRLDEIIKLLQSIAGIDLVAPDDTDWEPSDMANFGASDHVSM